ncbi:hypothetical protein BKA81DRAFT_39629 [Phyllosticta paracitricarpa]
MPTENLFSLSFSLLFFPERHGIRLGGQGWSRGVFVRSFPAISPWPFSGFGAVSSFVFLSSSSSTFSSEKKPSRRAFNAAFFPFHGSSPSSSAFLGTAHTLRLPYSLATLPCCRFLGWNAWTGCPPAVPHLQAARAGAGGRRRTAGEQEMGWMVGTHMWVGR